MNILETIIKKNDLIFDVGCNMGNKSQEFLKFDTKIVGFEPQPKCVNMLNNIFANNSSIIIEPIGLDFFKGKSFIYEATHHTISSMSLDFINKVKEERFTDCNWGKKIEIQVDTLDNMILKYGTPNYIKIDVEGYELNVLKGLSSSIENISIEFTPELCQNSIDCINYIETINGNCKYNYGYCNNNYFKYENWVNKEEIISYLKSVKDYKFEFGDIYIKKNKDAGTNPIYPKF
jgi:FkbM family methyltransferase